MQSIDFYDKLMCENYYFNNYKVLRCFIKLYCTHNLKLSKKIACLCMKSFTHYCDNIFPALEAIKELVLIEDQYSQIRREAIFGFPTVTEQKDFKKHTKFGLQVNKDISKAVLKYRTPLNFYNSSSASLMKIVAESYEKQDNNCLIYLVYLLDMMLESEEVFNHVVTLPSPFPLFANYVDWFEVYSQSYFNDKKTPTLSLYSVNKSTLYEEPFKEKMALFEEKYLAYVHTHYPEAEKEYCLMLGSVKDNPERFVANDLPILPLSKSLIVGCCKSEELAKEYIVYDDSDSISLTVSQLSVLASDNVPTGYTNMALPKCFRRNTQVYSLKIPQNSSLQRFFDIEEPTQDKSSTEDLDSAAIADFKGKGMDIDRPRVVLNINLNNMDEEGQDYPPKLQTIAEVEHQSETKETSTEDYDLKYYRTNYILK